MYRWTWKSVVVIGAMVAIASTSWAQDEESTGCENACYEAEESCLAACGDQEDPIVCEDDCAEETENCLEQCE